MSSSMGKKGYVLIGLGAIAILILIWWLKDQQIRDANRLISEKDKQIQDLEVNNLRLIQELLKADKTLPDIVKKQLLELITNYEIKDPKIALEIQSVINLISINEFEKAVLSISKIIENILKSKFQKEDGFKRHLTNPDGKKRKPVFAEYIIYAKDIKVISEAESLFALGLKEYRNEEAHDLGVKRSMNLNMSSILSAIELILKCDNYKVA